MQNEARIWRAKLVDAVYRVPGYTNTMRTTHTHAYMVVVPFLRIWLICVAYFYAALMIFLQLRATNKVKAYWNEYII